MRTNPAPACRTRGTAPAPRGRKPAEPFHAFIAYADVAAARRAMTEIRNVLKATGRRLALVPMLWRFDQLERENWRDHSITEAARASVVVLASSETHSLSEPLERWLGSLLGRKPSCRITVVALLGPSDAWTISIEASAPRAAGQSRRAGSHEKAAVAAHTPNLPGAVCTV